MAKQKAVNWPAIKKRYLLGEKPKALAEEYGVTAKAISDRATKQKWTRKKAQNDVKIEKDVQIEIDEVDTIYSSLINEIGKDFLKQYRDKSLGLTVQDGEGFPNKLAMLVVKAGLDLHIKQKTAEKEDPGKGEQESGFVGLPGINVDAI
jgi:hypothetical protein